MRTRAQVWHHDHGCPVNARHVATAPDDAMLERRINKDDAQRGISRAAGVRCPSFEPFRTHVGWQRQLPSCLTLTRHITICLPASRPVFCPRYPCGFLIQHTRKPMSLPVAPRRERMVHHPWARWVCWRAKIKINDSHRRKQMARTAAGSNGYRWRASAPCSVSSVLSVLRDVESERKRGREGGSVRAVCSSF